MLATFGVVALLLAPQSVQTIAGDEFSPAAVTVNQGETVTWTNAAMGLHNVSFDDGTYTQPQTPSTIEWTVSRPFHTPGTFSYRCDAHPSSMTGTVTVLPGAPGPGPGPGPGPAPGPGPGDPPPTPPGDQPPRVTLAVSDSTPRAGRRIRFSGFVSPARDGAVLQLQRRTRRGYRTVATTRLRDAGSARSKFSIRLRIRADGRYRARLKATGTTSRARRVNVV
jgi:copper binding plastocyanin/azurin family protein